MSINLVKNGTFLTGTDYWRADHIMGAEGLYEPGVGAPSPGCIKLSVEDILWQEIAGITKGRFEVRFQAKGIDPITTNDFVWLEVRFVDDVFQAGYSAILPFGMEGRALGDWVDYSGIIELPNMDSVNLVFESIEADSSASLYIDTIELEPLPEVLCDGLVHEIQKRRRDFNATKHPEERYKEAVTQAVNESPVSLWVTSYIDIEAEEDQHWYQLEDVVQKPEHVKRVLVHRIVGTDTEEEVIGRWTTEFGQDGHVYLHVDEAIYDGCILRVEYAEYPDFPACEYATTLPIDKEWVLCQAAALLLMEADPSLESPESIERDLQYWDAKRVAREAEVAPRARTARARTLRSGAYYEKELPCGDLADIVDGPIIVPLPPTPPVAPEAAFSTNGGAESSTIPFDCQFYDGSTGSIVKWEWSFGDGVQSNEEDPLHQYTEYGLYTVRLTVTDSNGRTDSTVKTDYVNVGIPNGLFSAAPLAGTDPWPVQLTDESEGNIESWLWNFGDDSSSTEQNPIHDYAATGNYTVTVTVTGPTGTSVSEEQVLPVGSGDWMPPIARFSADVRRTYEDTLTVQFSNDSFYGGTYDWDFGDTGSSTDENPSHDYTEAGIYTVVLTVDNPYGQDVKTKVDFIIVGKVLARFSTVEHTGYAPFTVPFRDRSYGTITDYLWDFGDDFTSTEQHPTHIYEEVGTYNVTLKVTGPAGDSKKEKIGFITVDPPKKPPPHAAFYADPYTGDSVPLDVAFTDKSAGDIKSWAWDFGDGETSERQNPWHRYRSGGKFTVTLRVTDDRGWSNTVKERNCIVIGKVTAKFSASPNIGDPILTVFFENLTEGIVDSYLWDFDAVGNPGMYTSEEFEPEFDYKTPGDYTVELVATGPVNPSTRTKIDVIHVNDYLTVTADFEPEAGILGDGEIVVDFVNKSTNAETYLWDFDFLANPGNDTSTEKDPSWLFTNDTDADKSWTVKLVATGPGVDNNDDKSKIYTLHKWLDAICAFEADRTVGDEPSFVVQFLNNSQHSETCLWDFDFVGNPGVHTSTDWNPIHEYTVKGKYTVKLIAYGIGGGDDCDLIKTDFITVREDPSPKTRVTDGLIVEYDFSEGSGNLIHDIATEGTPLHLTIGEIGKVEWGDGYLTVKDDVLILSNEAATKITAACEVSDEITLEAWVTRGATPSGKDCWIMGVMSTETSWFRNAAMGERPEDDQLVSRIRSATTGDTGENVRSETGNLRDALIHLVITRNPSGTVIMYQNAAVIPLDAAASDVGAFSNWDSTYKMSLANVADGGSPWFGSLHLVAIYDKALSEAEVNQNYIAGGGEEPPTDWDIRWVCQAHAGWPGVTTGDDENTGRSEAQAWKTLEHSIQQLVPGMMLKMKGRFQERPNFNRMKRDGLVGDRIRVLGVNANNDAKACVDGNYVEPTGGKLKPHDCPGGGVTDVVYRPLVLLGEEDGSGKGNYLTIENIKVMKSRGRGLETRDISGMEFLDVDIAETRMGCWTIDRCEDVIVEGCTSYHSANYCTVQRGPDANASWPHSFICHAVVNVHFRSCIAREPYGEGFGMHNCTDSSITFCRTYNTQNTGVSMNAAVDSEITHNFINYSPLWKGACGIGIAGEDTGGYSSMQQDNDNLLVANNVIYGASPGIRTQHKSDTWGMKNMSWYNNTIVHVRPPKLNPAKFPGGVCFKLASPSGGDGIGVHNGIGYRSCDIRNNLCFGTGEGEGDYTIEERGRMQMVWIGPMKPEWLDGITLSHNWFSHTPTKAKYRSPQDIVGGSCVEETGLSATREPEDAHVVSGFGGIAAGKDLRTAARPVTVDFGKNERPPRPTMGAWEPEE